MRARAVFGATIGYHHPVHAGQWRAPGIDAALDALCTLLIDRLRPR